MITWHPHTEIPTAPEVAIIAISPPDDETGLPEPLLLPEIYRFDVRMGVWVSEVGGLMLRHKEFLWTSESDLLATLVCRDNHGETKVLMDLPYSFADAAGRN